MEEEVSDNISTSEEIDSDEVVSEEATSTFSDPEESNESDLSFLDGYESDDDEDEDMSAKIWYIREKQKVLKRAASFLTEEAIYEAATALRNPIISSSSLITTTTHNDNSIWDEARNVLRAMGKKPGTFSHGSSKKNPPNPKDPKIDVSSVEKISSTAFNQTNRLSNQDTDEREMISYLSCPVFGEGQWMAQALVWSEPKNTAAGEQQPFNEAQDCNWKVVSDPLTCSLGLLPPSSMSMTNAVDIQEAIAVTNEARLVTQSTPPFSIVHVNRAFLMLAGCLESNSNSSFIGRPVESVVRITQDITGHQTEEEGGEAAKNHLEGLVTLAVDKVLPCQIRVHPVVDRSRRRRRLSSGHYSCMSHILIQVEKRSSNSMQQNNEGPSVPTTENNLSKLVSDSDGGVGTVG